MGIEKINPVKKHGKQLLQKHLRYWSLNKGGRMNFELIQWIGVGLLVIVGACIFIIWVFQEGRKAEEEDQFWD